MDRGECVRMLGHLHIGCKMLKHGFRAENNGVTLRHGFPSDGVLLCRLVHQPFLELDVASDSLLEKLCLALVRIRAYDCFEAGKTCVCKRKRGEGECRGGCRTMGEQRPPEGG